MINMSMIFDFIWSLTNFEIIKGMIRWNIEHFLKKRKYEKLGFSEMN